MRTRIRARFLAAILGLCSSFAAQVAPAEDMFEPALPAWTGRLGAVFLQRSTPAATPYIIDSNTGASLISPSGFDFPFQAGADVALLRKGQNADVDFRYFGVNQWNASQGPFSFGPGAAIAIPGAGAAPFPVDAVSNYVSNLNSAEVNLRRNVSSQFTVLAGFRYISLREKLAAEAQLPSISATTDIDFGTNNNLFGFQVGADGILWDAGNGFRIESVGKIGIYGNDAHSSMSQALNGVPSIDGSSSAGHTAFVGDLNFTGVYQLNQFWAVRAGYQLLWISGVALPNEQLHAIDFNTGAFSTNTTHSVFFHGALVGLERSW